MKKNALKVLSIVLALVMVVSCVPFSFATNAVISGSSSADYRIDNPSFATISDCHVYSEELVGKGGPGTDYYDDVVKYNKLLGETFPILNATLQSIEQRVNEGHLRYVFFTGDLTANGEEKNHELLGNLLRSFQEKMQKIDPKFHIYVIPGNHDVNRYEGGTKYDANGNSITCTGCSTLAEANEIATNAAEFAYYYRGLGYGEADVDYFNTGAGLNQMPAETDGKDFYNFPDSSGSLSYAVNLEDTNGQKMRLVAMDCCMYSEDVNNNTLTIAGQEVQDANTGGYMTEKQLNWVCEQSRQAVSNNQVAIGLNHFAVTPHFAVQPSVLKLFILNDWQRIASTMADAGMHYIFTGHQHAPDVSCYTSEQGETIYDVETGSLVNYSNTYRENYFELNNNGTIDFDTIARDCDTAQKVDLSKCWYKYDEAGNPVIVPMKYNAGANGKPFGEISKPFGDRYGIYLFAGTRLNADDNGDAITTVNGETIKPSLKTLAKNMVSGYLNGRTIDNIIRAGGVRGIVEGALGTDIASYLDTMFPGDDVTVSVITLKKSDVIDVIDMVIDEIDHSFLGYVDDNGNVVRENQLLLKVVNNLIDELLDYEIAGHTLGDIAMAAVISNYDCKPLEDTTFPWLQDIVNDLPAIYSEIDSDKTIRCLADYLLGVLLGKNVTTVDDEGNETTEFVEGELVTLLRGINISTDMIAKAIPDFAGILRYPAIRKLLFGTTSKTPDVITVVDNFMKLFAGNIKGVKDGFNYEKFETGEITKTPVTNTITLAEYFLFSYADDYLTDDQIHSVSSVLNYALQSFFIDPTSTKKSDIPYLEHYPFVNNYDLKTKGLMSNDADDYKATINYAPLEPKAPEDAWYQIPTTVAVTFGSDPATSKNINWFTTPFIDGTDVQIIPYKANATANDFADGSTVAFRADNSCKTIMMTYPNMDIGVFNVGESMSMNRHISKISGLSPDTKYTYRVGDASRNIWSEPASMQTSKGGKTPFTFIYLTDSQSQTEEQYKNSYGNVIDDAFDRYSDAKFVLHTGDVVDNGANMLQWQWALDTEGMADTTIAPVAGNHEPKGTNGKDGLLTTAFGPSDDTFFSIDHPEQDVSTGIYYDFDYNDAHIMILNTNDLNDDNTLSTAQLEWLANSVQSSNKTWQIVGMHKSLYSNASHYNQKDIVALRTQLSKVMPKLGIDVVLSGHDHVFLRTQIVNDNKVVQSFNANDTVNNPAGTVYLINGKSGVKDYRLKSDEAVKEYFELDSTKRVDNNGKQSYSAVSIDGNKLTVKSYLLNGTNSSEVDKFIITKSKLATPKLNAKTASKTAINLSWSKIDGAATYQLYRATSKNGPFKKIATTAATSYKDTGLKTGTTYYYKVIAGTGVLQSNPSNIASAKATIGAVSHFKANRKTSTSIQASWSKVAGAKNYKLYYSTSKNSGYKLAVTTSKLEYKITKLKKCGTYYLKVYASDGKTMGPSSYLVKIKL